MAGFAKDDPLGPIADYVAKVDTRLNEIWIDIVGKIRTMLKPFFDFIKRVRGNIKELSAKVGKTVVNKLLSVADFISGALDDLAKMVQEGRKFARNLLTKILKPGTELVSRVVKAVKSQVALLAKVFRQIVTRIATLLDMISPIETALSVISSFTMVLRLIIKWITDVTKASSAIKKAKSLVKKTAATVKRELKTVSEMVKRANALAPA